MDASPDEIRARAALDDNAVRLQKRRPGRPPRQTVAGELHCERIEPTTIIDIKALTGGTPRDLAERALDVLRLARGGASDSEIAARVKAWLSRQVDQGKWE